jgi:hypothetical protein
MQVYGLTGSFPLEALPVLGQLMRGAAVAVVGGMALPSAFASAAVPVGQHARPAYLSVAGSLLGVAVMSDRSAWAVGAATRRPDFQFSKPLLAHWDGRVWTQVTGTPLPAHGYLDGVVRFRGGAWAVGASGTHPNGTAGLHKPLILRLTGSTWTRVPYPSKTGGHLTAVAASSPANAWAVGSVMDAAADGPQLLVHWNGKAWKQVQLPAIPRYGWLTGVTTTSPDNAWAVGNTGPGAVFILHWDGRRWRVVRTPGMTGTSQTLVGVTATSARNAWAVGSDYGKGKTLVLHWNGKTWKRVPSPSPGGGPNSGVSTGPDNRLGAVAATSATSAWAVGWGSTRGLVYAPVILHWDGRKWTHVPASDPSGGGFLGAIGIGPSGHAWTVGETEVAPALTLFEHWDGGAWR